MVPASDPQYPLVFSGESPILAVYRTLEKVRDTTTTVLIEGESGSGKDALAHWLHFNSNRKNGPFVKIDFGAMPDELVESELFGHERGAFTGAIFSKLGKLDLGQSGSVVLDEVGRIEQRLQARLLTVVESKQFYRLGGTRAVGLDCRFIALSSIPLAAAVQKGMFREDLFFRLNRICVRIPSLRERREEIPQIASTLLEQLFRKHGRSGIALDEDCGPVLENHDFPGNLRELRNGLERALLLAEGTRITAADLPPSWKRSKTSRMATLEELERDYIVEVLKHTRGKKAKAAEILGISRKTLLEKRKKYGME